ncbi:MAG TPA: cytochrome c biogenesis protein CcdA [Anaerolineaceae bacterium]|nr:cytochrome c biogenesis protein CcdA [Anaerolineaceae bacterium]
MNVTVGLAFLAGMASFLSPCVFSLVPAYIGYLSGRSLAAQDQYGQNRSERWATVSHGLAFVIGFSVIFVLLGVAVSALGGFLYNFRTWLARIGGLVVIVFGLHMTGIIRIPFLEYDLRPQSKIDSNRSYFSSAMMGVFFSAGWSPCVGPVLGSILTLAMNGGSISEGIKLLSAYSAGLAIPFLVAAFGIGWVTAVLRNYRKAMRYVEVAMGVLLVVVGAMLLGGAYNQIASLFPGFFIDSGL